MNRLHTLTLIIALVLTLATNTVTAQHQGPTLLSVGDILGNYGLDTTLVNDTAAVMDYLAEQPQDYVSLTNACVALRTKTQQAIQSIENDYEHRDSLIWIDSNTAISDYSIYEYRLRRLADLMGRMSIRYSRLEQQRIEAEKEAARQRALEEARRQQEERDREANEIKGSIDRHHRAIVAACDGAGVTDKTKLKELRDLYYSYLMVYNKYVITDSHATNESIAQLDELNAFQNDLLENVLGNNSLPHQIENFKNQLKVRCDKENNDIYRSYSRVFKHTSVPIAFADVKEYEEYINRLNTVINVQNRYLQTIDLRATIANGTANINQIYGKKYREVTSSYKEVLKSINQVPSFTTNTESLNFIQELEDFIAAQQLYADYFTLLEDLSIRSDSIIKGKDNTFRDIVSAYRGVQPSLKPVPSFKNPEGGALYEEQLAEVRQVQICYLDVIRLRNEIKRNDDSLTANRKTDRLLFNGYKLLREQASLTPNFSTLERGRSFIASLNSHIEMQRLCLETLAKRRLINGTSNTINNRCSSYRNIGKAYSRMLKAYEAMNEISNTEDLRRYSRQCDYVIEMQEAFINLLDNENVADSNSKLKRESDIDKIKLILGLK